MLRVVQYPPLFKEDKFTKSEALVVHKLGLIIEREIPGVLKYIITSFIRLRRGQCKIKAPIKHTVPVNSHS